MGWALLLLGAALLVEGLLWALAPRLAEDLLAMLRTLGVEERRLLGLAAAALGAGLVWGARWLGVP